MKAKDLGLDLQQQIILTAITGKLCCVNFEVYQDGVETMLGRPVMTHEFADKEVAEEIREAFFPYFIVMMEESEGA